MSGGLAALLDDIAALARLAAASVDDVAGAAGRASAKAVGVVVDDTAVTPRYVQGIKPERELSIIKRIAIGSLRNKLLIILPAALILSQFAPWALTPILMLGGTYLCYEGAEKIWEKVSGHGDGGVEAPSSSTGPVDEDKVVSGAVRTDFILSAEIMVIALNEVAGEILWQRAVILIVVAIAITALVYGVVALIVKMDDVGLALSKKSSPTVSRIGYGLVKAMPGVLSTLATVGVVAMCWVGGHILLVGLDELGWHTPYSVVHSFEVWVHDLVPAIGAVTGWLANTLASAVFGVIVGGLVVLIMHAIPTRTKGTHEAGPDSLVAAETAAVEDDLADAQADGAAEGPDEPQTGPQTGPQTTGT